MIPILFDATATDFTTNGITRLPDATKGIVMEERNGMYELEMEYPADGHGFSEIKHSRIIGAVPCAGGSIQGFRIYRITQPINGLVTIYAQHVSYDLAHVIATPFSVASSASACIQTLAGLKSRAMSACNFTFTTDVQTISGYTQTVPAAIRTRLGGVEGSVLDRFGGEYEWDNFTVKLLKARGSDSGVTLRYGKNITDLTQEENLDSVVTGVVPYWVSSDGETVVYGSLVTSSYASLYPYSHTITYDFSQVYEEAPTVAQLNALAATYVNQTDIGIPKVSIDVSFIDLASTEEYKDVAPLQNVQLCDTVTVQFPRLGIDATAKVVRTEYDFLTERYNEISVGSIRPTLAETIAGQEAQIEAVKEYADTAAKDAMVNATAWLTSADGVIMARKDSNGTWKELFFMSSTATATSGNVLRINENGIGFSSSGYDAGYFDQAWTLDGKLVIGGSNTLDNTEFIVKDSSGTVIADFTKEKCTLANWILTAKSIYQDTLDGSAINTGMSVDSGKPAFWAGATYANASSAPFRVSHAGALTSTSGNIAGWNIVSDSIYQDSNVKAGMSVNTQLPAFWAGNTYANAASAPFRVSHDGVLTASGANITGSSTFAGTLSAATGKISSVEATNLCFVDNFYVKPSSGTAQKLMDYSVDTDKGKVYRMFLGFNNATGQTGIFIYEPESDTVGIHGDTSVTGGLSVTSGLSVTGSIQSNDASVGFNGYKITVGEGYISDVFSHGAYNNSLSGTTRAVRVNSSGLLGYESSSIRVKKNVTENLSLHDPCKLYGLPVVEFEYTGSLADGKTHLGLIAEDVSKIFPDAAYLDKDGNPCGWDERQLIPPILYLVKDLHKRVSVLEIKENA